MESMDVSSDLIRSHAQRECIHESKSGDLARLAFPIEDVGHARQDMTYLRANGPNSFSSLLMTRPQEKVAGVGQVLGNVLSCAMNGQQSRWLKTRYFSPNPTAPTERTRKKIGVIGCQRHHNGHSPGPWRDGKGWCR